MSDLKNTTGPASLTINAKAMTMQQLEQLCDDPARDKPGGVNVRALLNLDPDLGFFLLVQDGQLTYNVVDEIGDQVRFRTVESALVVLQSISGLSPDIGVFVSSRRAKQH